MHQQGLDGAASSQASRSITAHDETHMHTGDYLDLSKIDRWQLDA